MGRVISNNSKCNKPDIYGAIQETTYNLEGRNYKEYEHQNMYFIEIYEVLS